MENKHAEGYWASQLTDEQITRLLIKLTSKSKIKEFKKILNIKRLEKRIEVKYVIHYLHRYIAFDEGTVIIEDFKVKGSASHSPFYAFMINLFGKDYADEFIAYADDFIVNNEEDKWSQKLVKYKQVALETLNNQTTEVTVEEVKEETKVEQ